MELFHTPGLLFALCTLVAGIALFAAAAYLPSLFPPAFARYIGFGAAGASLLPVWAMTEDWRLVAGLGGGALALMIVIHLLQTRRATPEKSASAGIASESEPETKS